MNIIILSGSHRTNSQSEKVSKYIESVIKKNKAVTSVEIISLTKNPIPFLDDEFFDSENEKWKSVWKPISNKLKAAEGIVIVTPEWHGMSPSGVKNFLLLCSVNDVAHKAGLLVSVSAGMGGSYPIAELRMNGSKNNRICFIPEHVIVRDCNNVLNGDEITSKNDEILRNRITYTSNLFIEYAHALQKVRESGAIDIKTYPNGM